MKKLLALLLCTVCLLCAAASADEAIGFIEADGVQYTLVDRDGETVAVVTGVNADETGDTLVVPMEVDGYPVVNIRLYDLAEQITTVCTPDINLDIFTGNPSFVWVVYCTQAQAIENGYAPVEGLSDDDLILTSITECEYHSLLDTMFFSWLDAAEYALPEGIDIHTATLKPAEPEPLRFEQDGCTYIVREENWDDRLVYYITGVELPEDMTTLIIPLELDGVHVGGYEGDTIPEQVTAVYKPLNASFDTSMTAQFTELRYASYAWIDENGWPMAPGMVDGDYAIIEIDDVSISNGDYNTKSTSYMAADLIQSIGGHRLLASTNASVLYECGAFTYTLEMSNDSFIARIHSFNPAEGQDTLFIPPQLDGYALTSSWMDSFPEQLKTIYAPRDFNFYLNNSSCTYTRISYADYDYVQANKDSFKSILGEMTENDLALSSITLYQVQNGSSSSSSTAIPADSLLTEAEGYRLLNGTRYDYLSYTDGDIVYTFNDEEHTSVRVISMPVAADQTLLYVPSHVAGCIVKGVNMAFAEGTNVCNIIYPDTAWLNGTDAIPLLNAYRYYDKNIVNYYNYTGNHQYVFLMNVDTPTVALTGYSRYEYGDSVDDATVEYYDVPTSSDSVTIVHMLSPDQLTQYTHEDYSYINLADGTIAITKYNNEFSKSVVVPSRLNGLTVTATYGGQYSSSAVFSGSELTSVELPATLTKLGRNTFYASNLTTITIPDGLKVIDAEAFDYVSYKFKTLKLPEGLTTLGARWADGFSNKLKTVKLPSTVTEIPAYSFAYSSFAELKLSDAITSIGNSAFENMSYLKTLSLPSTLTVIPDRMVAGGKQLSKITIPEGVVSIGNDAFAGCGKLSSISFKSEGALTAIGDGAFTSTGISKLNLPEGVVTIGKNAATSCSSLTSVVLPDTVTSIGSYAFSGCAKLTKVTLSEGLTALPEGLFMGCKKLSAITIPASVTEIGEYVFEGCSEKLTITVAAGSFAEEWANANGYKVKVQKSK